MSEKSANQAQRDENERKGKETAKTQAEQPVGDLIYKPENHTPVPEAGWVHKGGPPDGGPEIAAGSKERAATDAAMERAPKDMAERVPSAPIGDPDIAHKEGIPYGVLDPVSGVVNIEDVSTPERLKAAKAALKAKKVEDDE